VSLDDDEGSSGVGLAAAAAVSAAMARAWASAASKEQRAVAAAAAAGSASGAGLADGSSGGRAGFRLVATVTNKMGTFNNKLCDGWMWQVLVILCGVMSRLLKTSTVTHPACQAQLQHICCWSKGACVTLFDAI
jgi:hypothetical protein